jgi:hypothetical protein
MESNKENKQKQQIDELAEKIAELFIRQIKFEQKNKINNFKKHGRNKQKSN